MGNGRIYKNKIAKPEKQTMMEMEMEFHGQAFSGPLPPPQALKEYENILPGSAKRVFDMAEKEAAHRHGRDMRFIDLEEKALKANQKNSIFGSLFSFCIAITGIICGTILVLKGKEISGLASVLTPLAVITTAFFYKEKQHHKQENKQNHHLQPKNPKN